MFWDHIPGSLCKIGISGADKNVTRNSEVRHPRCVGTITQKFCVLHFQSNTTIFHLVQWENTTTCFGPIGGPSSGCNLDLKISYKRCVGGRDLVISMLGAMA